MPEIDAVALRAQLDAEWQWREAELRALRNQITPKQTTDERNIALKALVVMLYAHFEGATKTLLTIYVNAVNTLNMKVGDAVPAIGAAAIDDVFVALNSDKKCSEFKNQLPDDTALHRFARQREFLDVAWQVAQRGVQINADKVIDTESNLKPVVLRKCLFRLGLDPNLAAPWDATLNQLLNRRNKIAHGARTDVVEQQDYEDLERAVGKIIDDIIRALFDASANRAYRRAGP